MPSISIWQINSSFFIAQADQWDAYNALTSWARERYQREPDSTHLLAIMNAETLGEALASAGWDITEGASGGIVAIACNRSSISSSSLNQLFAVLEPMAPFVRRDSYILLRHDDSMVSLYETMLRFEGGQLRITTQLA